MSDLQIFNNDEFGEVRIVIVEGKPYAVGWDTILLNMQLEDIVVGV